MDFPSSPRPPTTTSGLNITGDIHTPVSSPKRKRDCDSDSEYDSPRASPMRFRTELPSRPRLGEYQATSPTSPRSRVSRQLHALKLNKPDLVFSSPVAAFVGQDQSSMDSSSGSWNTSSPPTESEAEGCIVLQPAVLPEYSVQNADTVRPETPSLAPDQSLGPIPVSPMPLPSPLSQTKEIAQASKTGEAPFPPISMQQSSPTKVRGKSPPPSEMMSGEFTWTAAEITGHNPTDPADDGYGINGIGFRPTPAMAYARTQRRKQQVAEWKTREAKEARQKRLDRRKKLSIDMDLERHGPDGTEERRKVRFVDV